MRTLFLLCTAVTVLQVFDVSITGVSAATPLNPPLKPVDPNNNAEKPIRTTTRTFKKKIPTPQPVQETPDPDPTNPELGTEPNDDDSAETPPPKTIKESGKRVVKTLKRMATNRGVGLLNGFTGFLKKTGGAFNFFGSFLRNRASSVKDVAKESLGMLGSVSDGSARGAKNLLNSGRVIGTQAGKEMFSTLQKATSLGTSATKLGGTVIGTPLSIGEDVVGTASQLAKVPSKLSKMVTNGAIKPVLNYFGPNSNEEQPEEEEEEEVEETEKKEEKGEEKPTAPLKTPLIQKPKTPIPIKQMPKKSA